MPLVVRWRPLLAATADKAASGGDATGGGLANMGAASFTGLTVNITSNRAGSGQGGNGGNGGNAFGGFGRQRRDWRDGRGGLSVEKRATADSARSASAEGFSTGRTRHS